MPGESSLEDRALRRLLVRHLVYVIVSVCTGTLTFGLLTVVGRWMKWTLFNPWVTSHITILAWPQIVGTFYIAILMIDARRRNRLPDR